MDTMKLYTSTEQIKARPMTRGEYNEYRGWVLLPDEGGRDEGYLVEYLDDGGSNHPDHDGYISWSPKELFENAYQTSGNFSFGHAIELAKQGKRVARKGWNGAGMFAYVVQANEYPALSDHIKGMFPNDMVPYRAYWALKTAQNDVATWAPSASDSLAEDWCVVD